MTNAMIGLVAFAAIFSGAMIGMFGARWLPDGHLSDATRNAVSVSVAIIGTLAALVLGLMTSTASSAFTERSNAVRAISVDIIRIDRVLKRYGPDADAPRAKLALYTEAKTRELFPAPGQAAASGDATVEMLEAMETAVLELAPTDPTRTWLRSQAITLCGGLFEARWLLVQQSGTSIPLPFLVLLIFWLSVVFCSFGLFAPFNGTVIAALFLCSVGVSGGIFMILELGSPFSGLVHVSDQPMREALAELQR